MGPRSTSVYLHMHACLVYVYILVRAPVTRARLSRGHSGLHTRERNAREKEKERQTYKEESVKFRVFQFLDRLALAAEILAAASRARRALLLYTRRCYDVDNCPPRGGPVAQLPARTRRQNQSADQPAICMDFFFLPIL